MPPRLTFLAAFVCLCAPAFADIPDDLQEPGQHPVSIGFQDPDDLSALLDYRLPDWWSRVWTANVALDGAARSRGGYGSTGDNRLALDLDTAVGWSRHGERVESYLSGQGAASLDKSRYGDDVGHDGAFSGRVSGQWRRYVRDRWAVVYGGDARSRYTENVHEVAGDERTVCERTHSALARVGLGYGRVRDVTPAIRAARLNERLAALGHAPLAGPEVVRVAEALARQGAYGQVFARPDRRFWADALAPVTDRGPLAPYDAYYLAEVLAEDVGHRSEGFEVDGTLESRYSHAMSAGDDEESWQIVPVIRARWAHNVDLNHQVTAEATAIAWRTERLDLFQVDRELTDARVAQLDVEYLWAIADRILWTTALRVRRSEYEQDAQPEFSRDSWANLTSTYNLHLEDRVALRPWIAFDFQQYDRDSVRRIVRSFTYGINLTYVFDTTLN